MAVILGTSGNDVLSGDITYSAEFGGYPPTSDVIYGYAGDDRLYGRGGSDTLYGGSGYDQLFGDAGDDTLFGEEGNSLLNGGTGNDTFNMSAGRHEISDEQGDDTYQFTTLAVGQTTLKDLSGYDSIVLNFAYTLSPAAPGITGFIRRGTSLFVDLNADGGVDSVEGLEEPTAERDLWIVDFFRSETGSEPGDGFIESFNGQSSNGLLSLTEAVVHGTDRADGLTGRNEDQTMYGYNGNDDIRASGGNDLLYGGVGRDYLEGGRGNDLLSGEAGSDTLVGDTNDDILIGGGGQDWLEGGKGSDRFVFGEGAELTKIRLRPDGSYSLKNTKGDRITDFTPGQDKIVLDQSLFKNVNRLTMITTSNPRMDRLPQKIILNRYIGVLVYNQNGAAPGFGSGGIITELYKGVSTPVLTARDFILVP